MKIKIKLLLITLILVMFGKNTFSQNNVGINATGAIPHPSAALDVDATNRGVLIPRLTTAQRLSITNPANGLLVYDTNEKCVFYYEQISGLWLSLCDGHGLLGVTGPTGPVGPQGQMGPQGAQGIQGVPGPSGSIGPTGAQGSQGVTGATGPAGVIGTTGPQGTAGPTGAQGLPGVTGPSGAIGTTGPQGTAGPTGAQGLPGVTGPSGAIGTTGPQGTAGPTGAQGLQGVTGPSGAIGTTGPQGTAGPTGAQGLPGVTGPSGAIGTTGPQGTAGPTGAQGLPGVTGPSGAIGTTGPQGTAGPTGAQGLQGVTGPSGANGTTGPQGTAGPTGAQGLQGLPGPSGANGTTGPQGTAGPTGAQGLQGVTGPSGANGTTGPQGTAGPTGAQGLQGVAGPSGVNGTTGPQGTAGPAGVTGPIGASGAIGATGAQGVQGITGSIGPSGATGVTGPTCNVTAHDFNAIGTSFVTGCSNTITSIKGAWLTTLNTGLNTVTNRFGTTDSTSVDFYTTNVLRGRISSKGEFTWGATGTLPTRDLFSTVANANFPWAINGYTGVSASAGAIYGYANGTGSNAISSVQGEYDGDQSAGAGVRGISMFNAGRGVHGQEISYMGWAGYFDGDVFAGGNFFASDIKLKKNIKTITDPISKLMNVRGIEYDFRVDEFSGYSFDKRHKFGVVAQELELVFPDMVAEKSIFTTNCTKDNTAPVESMKIKTVNYIELIPVLIEAVKEQQNIIEGLKLKNEELEKRIQGLEKK